MICALKCAMLRELLAREHAHDSARRWSALVRAAEALLRTQPAHAEAVSNVGVLRYTTGRYAEAAAV